MDVPTYHKVLIITDGAINIAPTLEDKVDICQNAIDLAISLGIKQPKVTILAAVEPVTSKMPATIDAAALCKMRSGRQSQAAFWMVPWPSTMPSAKRQPRPRASTPKSLAIPIFSSRRILKRETFLPSNSAF